jgi:hypothetical protein
MSTDDIDMKDIWMEENKKLEERITINEKLLRSMTIEKAATSFDKLLKMSILGRNLALIYGIISVVYSLRIIHEVVYSVPAMLGAIAMFWSFSSHRPLKRMNFESSSVLDLQRSICEFRVHTNKMKLYDISIVAFWLVTLAPALALNSFDVGVYDTPVTIVAFIVLVVVVIGMVYVTSKAIYESYNNELRSAEKMLEDLKSFDRIESHEK